MIPTPRTTPRRPASPRRIAYGPLEAVALLAGALLGDLVEAALIRRLFAIVTHEAAGEISHDEGRALASERLLLSAAGAFFGMRAVLVFLGGRRPSKTAGMVRRTVARRASVGPDGEPSEVLLCAVVVNTRRHGEQLAWRTTHRAVPCRRRPDGKPGRRGRTFSATGHGSAEAALLAFAPPSPA